MDHPDDIGITIIGAYWGLLGIVALLEALALAAFGLSIPFALSSIPMGIMGITVAGLLFVVPFMAGIFFLVVAHGLWHEEAYGLWLAVALGILTGLGSLALMLLLSGAGLVSALAGMGSLSIWEFAPSLIIGFGSAGYLFWRRDAF